MEIKEVLKDAFKYIGKKEVHVNELTSYVKDFVAEYKNENFEKLKSKINAKLSNDMKRIVNGKNVENKNSTFVKGAKRGMYMLRKERVVANPISPDKPKLSKGKNGNSQLLFSEPLKESSMPLPMHENELNVFEGLSSLQIGKGGEFSVVSELLFRGFNANMMTVDDGVDITAAKEKDGKFFLIQVKTTTLKGDSFHVNIDKNSYSRYNVANMYYVIVVRFIKDKRPQNQYLIFNSYDIEKMVSIGLIGDTQKYYSLNFRQWNGDIHIIRQGKDDCVSFHLNNWNWIK